MKKWFISAEGSITRSSFGRSRQTMENLRHNTAVFGEAGQELLHGQRTEPLCDMRYGTYPLSWNGCELIACYNAAFMLGLDISFPQVVFEFELNRMHYLFPNGYWLMFALIIRKQLRFSKLK